MTALTLHSPTAHTQYTQTNTHTHTYTMHITYMYVCISVWF